MYYNYRQTIEINGNDTSETYLSDGISPIVAKEGIRTSARLGCQFTKRYS